MNSEDKDLPIANDYKKSTEGQGFQLPDFLTSGTGVLIGLGIVVVVFAVVYAFTHISFSKPAPNPLESHPGFASLRKQVENLAEVDVLCAKADRTACLCELSERIRDDHRAIDQILAADAGLRDFGITVMHAGAPTVTYSLANLPKTPDDADCLNTVSAPTIIDDDGSVTDAANGTTGAAGAGSDDAAGGAANSGGSSAVSGAAAGASGSANSAGSAAGPGSGAVSGSNANSAGAGAGNAKTAPSASH